MNNPESHLKKWALFVYFGANVPEAAVRDAAVECLLQLATVGSSDKVAVAAQLHLPGKWAHRYIMPERPPGSGPTKVAPAESFPNVNSADPWTIIHFFEWAAERCRAEKTMLVVWGHGYGLDDYVPRGARPHPAIQIINGSRMNGPFLKELDSAFQEVKAAIAPNKHAPFSPLVQTTGVFDSQYKEVIPNWQVAGAARICSYILSQMPQREFSIFAFDACTMAMAEIWCEFYECAKFGIASEAQEPDASFPYDRFLERLLLQPGSDSDSVAQMMVDAYVESYSYESDTYVTLSSCNLTQIDSLEKSIKPLATALTNAATDPTARAIIFKARNDCPIFDQDGFIDLGRFCEILEITLPCKDVTDACQNVRTALSGFVSYARYSPLDPTLRISQTTGLSVWFPPWLEDPSVEILEKQASIAYLSYGYPQTKFAQSTCWDEFLKHMASAN
ncbi:MAG TPA: clostripain-related cysteine peptidase [Terriglobia bacterium]|nr:clostripain-related cysteine peptidase [Terriglobia bacterium]